MEVWDDWPLSYSLLPFPLCPPPPTHQSHLQNDSLTAIKASHGEGRAREVRGGRGGGDKGLDGWARGKERSGDKGWVDFGGHCYPYSSRILSTCLITRFFYYEEALIMMWMSLTTKFSEIMGGKLRVFNT